MLQSLLQIVRDAGAKMLSYDHPEVYQKEGHANFVTQADIEVQAFLMDKLHVALPQAMFFAEEQENAALTGEWTFVIDPIDGTTNFMRERKWSSISVALLKDKEPVIGIVLNPYSGELFHGEQKKGAFLNGTPIHVSKTAFDQALVGFGTSPYQPSLASRSMCAAEKFLLQAGDLRRSGSAALDLCDIACGRSDIFWEYVLSPWDFAAGALLVTEAGGKTGCPGSGPLAFDRKMAVLAANPKCFLQAEKLLADE